MKIKELDKLIQSKFPFYYAMEGDNIGLLVGDENTEIKKILVCCDCDEFVVDEAIEIGANVILSHHPLMFYPVNKLLEQNSEQRTLRKLIKNDIALYTAHTNLDVGYGGINDYMASLLELPNCKVVDVVCENDGHAHGYGRIAKLNKPMTLKQLLDKCKNVFDLDGCRYVGEFDDQINTVAINTGGGAGILNMCIDMGADVLITGDVKYNPARDAYENNMAIIDIMHYDTEKIAMGFFVGFLKQNAPEVITQKSHANKRIYKVFS